MIIRSYDARIPPRIIAQQIHKTAASISTFYSRFIKSQFLPPREITPRTKVDGRLGLMIKKVVLETPKLGLRKFEFILREKLPDGAW